MNKIQYVVAFAYTVNSGPTMVPLILKKKPEYLVGMLNLCGGKINEGEDPIAAAVRELNEETGLEEVQVYDPMCYFPSTYMGRIEGTTCTIHHVRVPVVWQPLKPGPTETEEVGWYNMPELLRLPNLMPNLRVTIPLCDNGVKDWVVHDFDNNWRKKAYHSVTLFMEEPKDDSINPWNIQVRSVGHYRWEEEEE